MAKQSTMTYEEALKVKRNAPYAKVTIGYTELILPYEDGLALIGLLKSAEKLVNQYDNDKTRVVPIDANDVALHPESWQRITDIRVAALMGITYKELLDANERSASST